METRIFMIIPFVLGGLITQSIRMIIESIRDHRTKHSEGQELDL